MKSIINKNYIILIFSIFIFNSFYSQINLTNQLVGFYPFSGNSNDLSSFGINGIVYNASLTNDLNSNPNSAYLFNGIDAYIDCDTNNRGIVDTVTVSAWVKTTSTKYQWIVGKYYWPDDRGFFLSMNNGYPSINGRNNGGAYVSSQSSSTINDGNWHFVMGVIYANTWEIWVDCQLQNTTTSSASNPILANDSNLTIGNYYVGESSGIRHFFDGSIDQVRLYNRVLTTDEKNFLCNNQITDLSEIKSNINYTVYPNPTTGENITVNFPSENKLNTLNIYDINGKIIKSISFKNNTIIQSKDFKTGIYFFSINDGIKVYTKKVSITN